MPLEFLFGRRKTPEEILKQNQRALNKVRSLLIKLFMLYND